MQKAKWIWIDGKNCADDYVYFYDTIDYDGTGKAFLSLSCDGNYVACVNNQVIAFGQYHDYPHYKIYDKIEISSYLNQGKNQITILVWYYGYPSYNYTLADAGLIYEIVSDGVVLAYSKLGNKCRRAEDYKCFEKRRMSVQIGLTYTYLSEYCDEFKNPNKPFSNCVEVNKLYSLYPRPVSKLLLQPTVCAKLIDKERKVYDLGKENAGLVHLRFKADKGCKVTFAFGEYVTKTGDVLRYYDYNDFSFDVVGNGEFFEYKNYLRRIGCRYFQVICDGEVEIDFIGLMPTPYPTEIKPFKLQNPLYMRIYDTCIDTLLLCRHEHYEDCPWREQSLYTLDSRNQMLCGYYAFEGYEFAKSCLELISKSHLNDGMLPHCFPCDLKISIPAYSLYYIFQMHEYAKYSKDVEFVKSKFEFMEGILSVFNGKIGDLGLLKEFVGAWNFYEFSDGLEGDNILTDEKRAKYSLILNCAYLIAMQRLDECYKMSGESPRHEKAIAQLSTAIKSNFYISSRGLFTDFVGEEHYSVLGNAFAILSGIAEENAKQIAKKMMDKTQGLVPTTLSMKTFEYDSVLLADESNATYVLSDISDKYGYMLSQGATTFWETLEGYAQYGGAGSLCHGWSAIPIIYFHRLLA